MIEPTAIRISTSAVFRALETGGVILNVESGDYFELNATGRFLWEQVQSGSDLDALAVALAEHYGIDQLSAQVDVGTFVEDLRKRHLIEG